LIFKFIAAGGNISVADKSLQCGNFSNTMGAVKALNMIDSTRRVGEFADLETFALPHTSVKSKLENTSWELVQISESFQSKAAEFVI
jgi:hypothetical protein